MKISPHQRVRNAREVVADRTRQARDDKRALKGSLRKIPPIWLVTGALAGGLLLGKLSTRGLVAATGALAGFTMRLMSTPIGAMTWAAWMDRRRKQAKVRQSSASPP